VVTLLQNYMRYIFYLLRNSDDKSGILIHCISGWDRTPMFVGIIRILLWAEGLVHKSLDADQILFLVVGYDWLLFGHQLISRLKEGSQILYFSFWVLQHLLDDEFSLQWTPGKSEIPKPISSHNSSEQSSTENMPSPKIRINLNKDKEEDRSTSWRIKAIKRDSNNKEIPSPVSPRRNPSIIDKLLPRIINPKPDPKRFQLPPHDLPPSLDTAKEPDDHLSPIPNHIPSLKLCESDFSQTPRLSPPFGGSPHSTGSPQSAGSPQSQSVSPSPHEVQGRSSPTKGGAIIDDHPELDYNINLTLPPLESDSGGNSDLTKSIKPREGAKIPAYLPNETSVFELTTDIDLTTNSDRRDYYNNNHNFHSTDLRQHSPKDHKRKEKFKKKKNKTEEDKKPENSIKWKVDEPEKDELNPSYEAEDYTKWNRPQFPTPLNSRQQKVLDVWNKFNLMYGRTIEPLHYNLK